jgi:hypothetical protein
VSHQASAWALDARQTGRLGAGARLVLATLADYADPQGHGAYPSKATIAARLDLDVDTVRKHLRSLEASGHLIRGDQHLVSHFPADKRPTVYNLTLRRGTSEVSPRSSEASERTAAGAQSIPERGDRSEAQTKNITTPENSPQTPRADLDDDIDHDVPLALQHAAAEAARRHREQETTEASAAERAAIKAALEARTLTTKAKDTPA